MNPFRLLRQMLCCLLMLSATAHAQNISALHEKIDALTLDQDPYWHLLLHYAPAHNDSGWRSEAMSPAFFLSRDGRENPRAELHALLDALYRSSAALDDQSGHALDDQAGCRFPARREWLQSRLGEPLPAVNCPALKEWLSAIRPDQATLVFASDFLNSPSSMFGHTFLRIDAPEQTEDTRLLAYAINFAANAGTSNPLSFAWNGLTGGFPGVFSLLPYYDKVKEYSDMENRDLWEYQLNFTAAELQRLLQHVWELRNVDFPYFFLTRNCSYQLLGLFEVARPGLQMRKDFPVQAIPSDTLRRVLEEPGMLRKLVYRPAAERRLLQDAKRNPHSVNKAARKLADSPSAPLDLPAAQQAAALETAYDFRYYRFLAGEGGTDANRDLRQLLIRRSTIPVDDLRTAPPQPDVDPANGHATARVALAAGQARDASYVALRLRPAYHDLLDAPGGYRRGAHIDFLDTELRVDDERKALRLEYLRIIDIDSVAPWDDFFRPWSWFFSTGQRQAAVDRDGRFSTDTSHGVGYLDLGGGADFALSEAFECYGQLATDVEAGAALEKNVRLGAGPRAGCLYSTNRWRWRLQADSRYYNDLEGMQTKTTLEAQFDLGRQQGLRLQLGRLQHEHENRNQGELSWLRYF